MHFHAGALSSELCFIFSAGKRALERKEEFEYKSGERYCFQCPVRSGGAFPSMGVATGRGFYYELIISLANSFARALGSQSSSQLASFALVQSTVVSVTSLSWLPHVFFFQYLPLIVIHRDHQKPK